MNLLPIEHRDTNFNQSNTMYAPELSIGCRTHDNFTCLHEPRGPRFLPTQIHIYSTAKCASAQQTHSRVAQLDPICYYITIKPAIIAFIPFGWIDRCFCQRSVAFGRPTAERASTEIALDWYIIYQRQDYFHDAMQLRTGITFRIRA